MPRDDAEWTARAAFMLHQELRTATPLQGQCRLSSVHLQAISYNRQQECIFLCTTW